MHLRFRSSVAVFAILFASLLSGGGSLRAEALLSGFSTTVALDAEGAWIFLFVDGSGGPRSVLISAAGPGYAPSTTSRVVSDPQIEVQDASGNRIAYNDDRADVLLSDASLPNYARAPKDAALRVSLSTGTYVVRVTGVNGATGVAAVDVIDGSTRPGIASFALRARGDSASTPVRLRYSGGGTTTLAMYLSGPNLPVTNPLEDPRLTLTSVSVIGNGDGTFTATNQPFVQTWDTLQSSVRYRSPVTGDPRNAGSTSAYSFAPNQPFTLNVQDQAGRVGGMFLLEVHNLDVPSARAPVVYAVPASATVGLGTSTVLRALVGGDDSTVVTFELNGTAFASPSSGILILSPMGPELAGTYRVRATSPAGTAVSAPFVLSLAVTPPGISASPQSQTVTVGQTAQFSVTASGTSLNYQWRKNGVDIPGATASIFVLPAVSLSDAGSYTVRVSNSGGSLESNAGVLTVNAVDQGRLVNLSVRALAGTGDRTLILGFSLAGAGAKSLLLRGVGPGLAAFGVSSAIPDPRLGVFVGDGEIFGNNDWQGDDGRALGAFALAAGSRDAVVSSTFGAASYTAQISGADGRTGEAIIEVYDASTTENTMRLVNLSTRTQVDDGQRLIVGLTLGGDTTRTLAIRAIGPTLRTFGLSTAHPDPRIELYAGSVRIAENDQWQGEDGRSAGAFPLGAGSLDAALVRALPRGSYSVHVSGAAGTSGVVLVEVYLVP